MKLGVLISGRGSNLRAILAAAAEPSFPVSVAQVIANNPAAPGLAHAADAGVPKTVVDHRDFPGRPAFEAALTQKLADAGIEMICLAGFMRILSGGFVDRWWNRIVNVHPSLLPAFPGADAVGDALAAGVKVTGTSVHMVRAAVDAGPILGQGAVPVLPDDDADSLGQRIRAVEHRLLPTCLAHLATGRMTAAGDTVISQVNADNGAYLANPPLPPQ